MTGKLELFKKDLEKLCKEHKVKLILSKSYDWGYDENIDQEIEYVTGSNLFAVDLETNETKYLNFIEHDDID